MHWSFLSQALQAGENGQIAAAERVVLQSPNSAPARSRSGWGFLYSTRGHTVVATHSAEAAAFVRSGNKGDGVVFID
jgi:hypothetical protein